VREALAAPLARVADAATARHVLLVASELVTNGVVHGRPPLRVVVHHTGDAVRVEVADGGDGAPEVRERMREDDGGFGLRLVEGLARRWGAFEGSAHVWAEVPVTPPR
jgi:two-component sensor histidine kinase